MKTIKSILTIILLLIVSVSRISSTESETVGEPVPGAEVYVELEPDKEPIANIETNNYGEFMFQFPDVIKIPKNGIFTMTILPPKKLSKSQTKKLVGMGKQVVQVSFKKKDGPKFKYTLTWEHNSKAQNKGSFAVSGKNST
jgi:hypothetical protein